MLSDADARRQIHESMACALQDAVTVLAPDLVRVAGYHHGYLDADGQLTEANPGKAMRPALVLLSAQAAGAEPSQAIPAAVATELVHNFSLLHDDIMDGDTTRRHRATAWTVFGTSAAILTGDGLFAAALDLLLAQPTPGAAAAARLLTNSTLRLINGQAADLDFELRDDVSLTECMSMAADKTAALFSCAASIGAVFCGAAPDLVRSLGAFGEHLGLAFQIADDVLGIWGSPTRTGKPVLSDLRSRKKSLPVVVAITSDRPEAAELRQLYLRPNSLDDAELVRAAELIERCGARDWAEATAQEHLNSAFRALDEVQCAETVRDEFQRIARLATARDS
jgi:geranylgeranyl diphosphate synthase type I